MPIVYCSAEDPVLWSRDRVIYGNDYGPNGTITQGLAKLPSTIRNYGDDGTPSTTSPPEPNAIRNYGDDGSPSTTPPPDACDLPHEQDPPLFATPKPYVPSFWKKDSVPSLQKKLHDPVQWLRMKLHKPVEIFINWIHNSPWKLLRWYLYVCFFIFYVLRR